MMQGRGGPPLQQQFQHPALHPSTAVARHGRIKRDLPAVNRRGGDSGAQGGSTGTGDGGRKEGEEEEEEGEDFDPMDLPSSDDLIGMEELGFDERMRQARDSLKERGFIVDPPAELAS